MTDRERTREARYRPSQKMDDSEVLDAMIESTRTGLCYLDPHFNIVRVNSVYAAACGHPRSELIGRNHFDLFPSNENRAMFERARDTGERVEFTAKPFRFADEPSQATINWDWTLTPIRNSVGGVQGLVLSLIDATVQFQADRDRQRLLEELMMERALLESVLRQLPCGVIVAEPSGKIMLANAQAGVMLGQPSLGTGRDYAPKWQAFHRGGKQPYLPEEIPLARSISSMETVIGEEIDVLRGNGECGTVTVSSAPVRDDEGNVVAAVAIFNDVTERRRVADELRKLSRAVEQSPSSVVITDTEGDIEYVNPKFSELTGYDATEVIGRNPRLLKSGETPSEEYRRLWQTITTGGEWRGEFHNKKKNGELYWEWASISGIRDSDGNVTHYLAVKEDITARKRGEQFREDYISLISHDLRNPLTTIGGLAGLLQRKLAQQGLMREAGSAQGIVLNVRRMAVMIRDLLETAMLEAGELTVHKKPVDLAALLRDLVHRLGWADDRGRINVESEVVEPVFLDRDRMERVIANLITNAMKYSPSGTPVVVRLRRLANEVIVSVADQGVGIQPEEIPHLFERYYRGRAARTTEGIGLGLYSARLIVAAHGGRIWVESHPGKGSTFSFALPLS